jgi:hypothetical protein
MNWELGIKNGRKSCHCGLDPQSPGQPRTVGAGRALPSMDAAPGGMARAGHAQPLPSHPSHDRTSYRKLKHTVDTCCSETLRLSHARQTIKLLQS